MSSDYQAYGGAIEDRQFASESYRYGFNGMEKDNEIKGENNAYDFGGRSIYDGRLARFISVDPDENKYPTWSPYCYAANNPIRWVEVEGKGPGFIHT
jgi:RHS repeat-associated protein